MIRMQAHAKINWSLDIRGKHSNGYHEMDMLMQTVSLYDEIVLEESDGVTLETLEERRYAEQIASDSAASEPVPYDDRNLMFKAALLMREYCGIRRGVRMLLGKHIPSGAGMGGGSADAAAVLAGLNMLWKVGLSYEELCAMGAKLGADVPFMLTGGLARVGGFGEKIVPQYPALLAHLVLIKPCPGLNTGAIFKAYDWESERQRVWHPKTEQALDGLLRGELPEACRYMGNVLEPAAVSYRPEISEALSALREQNAVYAAMTGSGAVVFGVYESEADAKRTLESLQPRYLETWYVCTVPMSETIATSGERFEKLFAIKA